MEIKEVRSKVLLAPFVDEKPNKVLEIEGLRVEYRGIKLYDYVNIIYSSGKIKFNFGCQTVELYDLKSGLRNIKGEKLQESRKVIQNKKTKKIIAANLKEESENYLISDMGRAYHKSTFHIIDSFEDKSIVKIEKVSQNRRYSNNLSYFSYKGWVLGTINEKKILISKLTYLIELGDILEEYINVNNK